MEVLRCAVSSLCADWGVGDVMEGWMGGWGDPV